MVTYKTPLLHASPMSRFRQVFDINIFHIIKKWQKNAYK